MTGVQTCALPIYLSKDPYCSSPIEVFTTQEPGFVDFIGGPTIGQLDNSKFHYDGTYRCVAIKMSETVQFVPNLGTGICAAGTRFETNLCNAGMTTTGIDGTTSTCTAAGTDNVFIYLSTGSTAATFNASTNPFIPPTIAAPNNGINLAVPITINGSLNARLIFNAYGRIEVLNGTCQINNPGISLGL